MRYAAFTLTLSLFLAASLPADSYAADKDKSKERKKESAPQNYEFLSPKQQEKIRDIRDRYQELPPQKKRQLREKWQEDKRDKQKK